MVFLQIMTTHFVEWANHLVPTRSFGMQRSTRYTLHILL